MGLVYYLPLSRSSKYSSPWESGIPENDIILQNVFTLLFGITLKPIFIIHIRNLGIQRDYVCVLSQSGNRQIRDPNVE